MADEEKKIEETKTEEPQAETPLEATASNEKTPVETEETAKKKKKRVPKRSKKGVVVKQVPQGRIYIQATYNNTLVTATDAQGNVIAWSSAGHLGFKGPRKSTPYAAGAVIRDLTEKVKPMGLSEVQIFVKGIGSGREAAVRALNAQGFQAITIKDVTPLPHNGCRKPRPRRV